MLDLWSVFDDVMRFEPWAWSNTQVSQPTRFAPALDAMETEDAWLVHVELPGVKPEDVNLEREGDVLTISGKKMFDAADGNRGYRFNERRYGHFSRAITLPGGVDDDAIEANMKDGVLAIRLPKVEQARPKQIPIKVGAELGAGANAQLTEGEAAPDRSATSS